MGLRIGALCLAIPDLVVLAAIEGFSFILLSPIARLLHMGLLIGPILPDTADPFEELIFLAIFYLVAFFLFFVVLILGLFLFFLLTSIDHGFFFRVLGFCSSTFFSGAGGCSAGACCAAAAAEPLRGRNGVVFW